MNRPALLSVHELHPSEADMIPFMDSTAFIRQETFSVQPCPVGAVEVTDRHSPFTVKGKAGMHAAHTAVIKDLVNIFPNLSHNTGDFLKTDLLPPACPDSIQATGLF